MSKTERSVTREFEPGCSPIIEINSLTVLYGTTPAVNNVTFSIPQREITAIIGPSGCGKSTLLRAITQMNEIHSPGAKIHQSGTILYDGKNIMELPSVMLRKRIGMVFQQPNPFPKTIFDNVAYGPRRFGIKGEELNDVVRVALEQANLWNEVSHILTKRRGATMLSGGQQQRLCIARALANNPQVILMDEPTASLDPIAMGKIEDTMETLVSEHGKTIVLVTHLLSQARRVAKNIAVMHSGELIDYDKTERILPDAKGIIYATHPFTIAFVEGKVG